MALPTGATLTVVSDGNTANTGRFIAVMSGTYTAADFSIDATSYPSTAATRFGIKPNLVRITNLTDRITIEAVRGQTNGLLSVAAGTRTFTAHGLTLGERSIAVDVSVNSIVTDNDTILFEVFS
jgi:hypothetical protein